MPKLITNSTRKPQQPIKPALPANVCTATYTEYINQRQTVQNANISSEKITNLTEEFQTKIAAPIHVLNPQIEMGQYFVVSVAELREMIDNPVDSPEFIHINNALRDAPNKQGIMKTFPVSILTPVKKNTISGIETYVVCDNDNSVYIEAFPCPPAEGCPKSPVILHPGIFNDKIVLNTFNALF